MLFAMAGGHSLEIQFPATLIQKGKCLQNKREGVLSWWLEHQVL